MELTTKQKELLHSITFKRMFEEFKVAPNTFMRMRKNIDSMQISTIEKVLRKVWSMSYEDFMKLK